MATVEYLSLGVGTQSQGTYCPSTLQNDRGYALEMLPQKEMITYLFPRISCSSAKAFGPAGHIQYIVSMKIEKSPKKGEKKLEENSEHLEC